MFNVTLSTSNKIKDRVVPSIVPHDLITLNIKSHLDDDITFGAFVIWMIL